MEPGKLKLGKGSAFVKSRLRTYPQEDDVWEADFQPVSKAQSCRSEFWLGMVVTQDVEVDLAHSILDLQPGVNDLARLLANAIQRPLINCTRHRPTAVLLRRGAPCHELLPHLRDIGVEVALVDSLPVWRAVADTSAIEFARMLRSVASRSGKNGPVK